jgi:hypothetical protein
MPHCRLGLLSAMPSSDKPRLAAPASSLARDHSGRIPTYTNSGHRSAAIEQASDESVVFT